MTTARVTPMFPVGEEADETVRRTINALIKGRGYRSEDVAASVGIAPRTMYRRLRSVGSANAFTGGEIAALARFFSVSTDSLFSGMGGMFTPPPGTVCAVRDLNPEPAD